MMNYREKTEYAYLPCEEQAIEKALRRMGSSDFSCDSVQLGNCNIRNDVCKIIFEKILEDEGVFAVNERADVSDIKMLDHLRGKYIGKAIWNRHGRKETTMPDISLGNCIFMGGR